MKWTVFLILAAVSLNLAGCAQKSASEQLKDDMNKAAKKMDKEVKGFLN